jgi:hypothetical protein
MTEGIANYFGVLLMAIRAVFEYFWLPVGKILIFFSTLSTLYLATCAKYRCRQYPLFRCNLMPARALPRIRQKYEGESISIVMPSGLSPMGKKSRGGRGLLALWHGRKIEFSSLTLGSGLPCPSTLYTPPSPVGFGSLPWFASSSGWAEFQKCSRSHSEQRSALTDCDG